MKRFIALARVSSREQEREGFSLDVQEDAFMDYVNKNNGEIIKTFRIAETASKSGERKIFKEATDFAKKNHEKIDAFLFYKIDRAARNLKDMVLLEELEEDYGIEFISITQPTQNTPTGRMMRRQLATIASFTTEQQSLDVREGIAKRVKNGLPPSRAPFGYQNVRQNGRSIVEVHSENGFKIQEIFKQFAYQNLSVEKIRTRLFETGMFYSTSKPKFSTSKIYAILHDRSYIGEVKYHGNWHAGIHDPLIDETTWDRTQVILGKKIYRSHEMLYAGELITCGHCGRPVSGESKEKKTKSGVKHYKYYRCAGYNKGDHPRLRTKEADLEDQILAFINKMREGCAPIQSWLTMVAQARVSDSHKADEKKVIELKRQLSRVSNQQDELLELRLDEKINDILFDKKQADLHERYSILNGQIESHNNPEDDKQVKNPENIFQKIIDHWKTADYPVKRRILELIFSNITLDGEILVASNKTPFEKLLAT